MSTQKQCLNYNEVELISTQQPEPFRNKLKLLSVLQGIGRYLLTALTKTPEVRIWQTSDRFGQTWWNIYDPQTGESTQQASEQDVLIWLEERYSHRNSSSSLVNHSVGRNPFMGRFG